jgi:hypothetical protein
MPKVVKNSNLSIRGETGLGVFLHFSPETASYSISHAKNIDQARSVEDTITGFFGKYTTSRIFSPYIGLFLGMILFTVAFIGIYGVALSYYRGNVLAFRPLILSAGICAAALVVYIPWSALTAESPPISFVHSIIYLDRPSSHSMWILVSTILIGIVISVLSNWMG